MYEKSVHLIFFGLIILLIFGDAPLEFFIINFCEP
jgi:hypothetical protein